MRKATDTAALARRRALGRAIREARGQRTQADLAQALGVPQPSVCRWEQGCYELTCEQVHRLEIELDLPLGSLGAASGYSNQIEQLGAPFRKTTTSSAEEALLIAEAAWVLGLRVALHGAATPARAGEVPTYRWTITVATTS